MAAIGVLKRQEIKLPLNDQDCPNGPPMKSGRFREQVNKDERGYTDTKESGMEGSFSVPFCRRRRLWMGTLSLNWLTN